MTVAHPFVCAGPQIQPPPPLPSLAALPRPTFIGAKKNRVCCDMIVSVSVDTARRKKAADHKNGIGIRLIRVSREKMGNVLLAWFLLVIQQMRGRFRPSVGCKCELVCNVNSVSSSPGVWGSFGFVKYITIIVNRTTIYCAFLNNVRPKRMSGCLCAIYSQLLSQARPSLSRSSL